MNSANELIQRPRYKQSKAELKYFPDGIFSVKNGNGWHPEREACYGKGDISDFDITVGSDFHRGRFGFFLLRKVVHRTELGKPVQLLSGSSVVMRSNAMRVEDSSKSESSSVCN
uniref:Uncharacterized protein n=1 Tax=Anthoceros agrestis TaxID=41834 RepID=A0A6M8AYK7_9EMBR|nr:hypothetical protein [Anthoceros agrestis]QKD76635.1 hypothetical protein [Anthoceros agrestis]